MRMSTYEVMKESKDKFIPLVLHFVPTFLPNFRINRDSIIDCVEKTFDKIDSLNDSEVEIDNRIFKFILDVTRKTADKQLQEIKRLLETDFDISELMDRQNVLYGNLVTMTTLYALIAYTEEYE